MTSRPFDDAIASIDRVEDSTENTNIGLATQTTSVSTDRRD